MSTKFQPSGTKDTTLTLKGIMEIVNQQAEAEKICSSYKLNGIGTSLLEIVGGTPVAF